MNEEPKKDVTNNEIYTLLGALGKDIEAMTGTMRTLSDILSTHVRSNLETLREVRDYISQQIAYRSYREDIEGNRLKLEIEQKQLEIKYKEKLLHEEASENDALKLELDKLRLERDNLKENLEVLKVVKQSTQDKLKAAPHVQPSPGINNDVKRTIILTAVGFLTTSVLGGALAVIVFIVRLYMQSNP